MTRSARPGIFQPPPLWWYELADAPVGQRDLHAAPYFALSCEVIRAMTLGDL